MSFSRPIQWFHSHADPIWPDGTFKGASTKRPILRTTLPYITVLVCVIPCIIYS